MTMALIEIKELHLHIDFTGLDQKANKILSQLLKLETIMAKTKEELKAEFAAGFGDLRSSLENISADIDRLIAGTTPQGGLSEEEVEEQLASLRDISSALKTASEKVPEQPAPEA